MHTSLSSLEIFSDPGYTHSEFLQTQFSSSAGARCGYSDAPAWLTLRTLRTNREELETFHEGSEI